MDFKIVDGNVIIYTPHHENKLKYVDYSYFKLILSVIKLFK